MSIDLARGCLSDPFVIFIIPLTLRRHVLVAHVGFLTCFYTSFARWLLPIIIVIFAPASRAIALVLLASCITTVAASCPTLAQWFLHSTRRELVKFDLQILLEFFTVSRDKLATIIVPPILLNLGRHGMH